MRWSFAIPKPHQFDNQPQPRCALLYSRRRQHCDTLKAGDRHRLCMSTLTIAQPQLPPEAKRPRRSVWLGIAVLESNDCYKPRRFRVPRSSSPVIFRRIRRSSWQVATKERPSPRGTVQDIVARNHGIAKSSLGSACHLSRLSPASTGRVVVMLSREVERKGVDRTS